MPVKTSIFHIPALESCKLTLGPVSSGVPTATAITYLLQTAGANSLIFLQQAFEACCQRIKGTTPRAGSSPPVASGKLSATDRPGSSGTRSGATATCSLPSLQPASRVTALNMAACVKGAAKRPSLSIPAPQPQHAEALPLRSPQTPAITASRPPETAPPPPASPHEATALPAPFPPAGGGRAPPVRPQLPGGHLRLLPGPFSLLPGRAPSASGPAAPSPAAACGSPAT